MSTNVDKCRPYVEKCRPNVEKCRPNIEKCRPNVEKRRLDADKKVDTSTNNHVDFYQSCALKALPKSAPVVQNLLHIF